MNQSGATLLELMVVLAVSAILLGIGIPSFASFTSNSRLASATNEMLSSLHLARSEAIKRRSRAAMCPSATGDACAESGDWDQGWVVFHDANNNAELDTDEVVIMVRQGLSTGMRLTGNSTVSHYISFAPDGGSKHVSGAWQAGTLTVCNKEGTSGPARQIVISKTGRPRTTVLAACPY